MDMDRITVVLIDDHPVIQHGVASYCNKNPNIEVVAWAEDHKSAIAAVREHKPDIIVLDISVGLLNGLDFLGDVKEISPKSKTIVYTTHNVRSYLLRAFKQGAQGYALKSDPLNDLVEAIIRVHRGGLYLSSNLPGDVLQSLVNFQIDDSNVLEALSPREFEVANLLAHGKTPSDIAEILYISPKTVRVHRSNIMKKLSCDKVNELILRLIEYFPQ